MNRRNIITETVYYDGFLWSIISIFAIILKQSRPIAILPAIFSIIVCTMYLRKHNDKISLSVTGIVLSILVLLLYLGNYFYIIFS